MSAPIRDHAGRIIAAMTIPFVKRLTASSHPTLARTRSALIQSCRDVSAMLGDTTFR
jgi:DNA-binding IclR family transcriptional regulator